jgi:hypothetical protein
MGICFVLFLIGAVCFSPLFYSRSQNARTWDKLLSLHRWAATCEKVILGLGLNLDSRLPESLARKSWPGWPDHCSGGPVAASLERSLTAIVNQLSSRMVGLIDDATANEILALRTEIDRLAAGQRTEYQAWIAGQGERTAETKRWEFLRDQLEQVGREIIAGHRLSPNEQEPGRQITLQDCPSCRGPITSESTICSHCARPISIAGSGQ